MAAPCGRIELVKPATASGSAVQLRRAQAQDIERIADIEQRSFSDPWSATSFQSLVDASMVHFVVATVDDRVAGYVVMWMAADEAEIANLGVSADARRQGVGSTLLQHAIAAARAARASVMFLEVRESNTAALQLYHAHGFSEVGRRKRYYRKPEEDALVLRLDVDTGVYAK